MTERRRLRRFETSFPATLRDPQNKPVLAAVVHSLSGGGLGCRLAHVLIPGERFEVRINLMDQGSFMRLKAEVMWCRRPQMQTYRPLAIEAGLRFLQVDPADARLYRLCFPGN